MKQIAVSITDEAIETWIKGRDPGAIAQLLVHVIERERGQKLPDGKYTVEIEIKGEKVEVSMFGDDVM